MTGIVSRACMAVGIGRQTAYDNRKQDKTFAIAWDEALEISTDLLEEEARRRAFNGVKKPIYQGGKRVGYVQEYSDTLLIFLLKANRKKFREKIEHTGEGGGVIQHRHAVVMVPARSE